MVKFPHCEAKASFYNDCKRTSLDFVRLFSFWVPKYYYEIGWYISCSKWPFFFNVWAKDQRSFWFFDFPSIWLCGRKRFTNQMLGGSYFLRVRYSNTYLKSPKKPKNGRKKLCTTSQNVLGYENHFFHLERVIYSRILSYFWFL